MPANDNANDEKRSFIRLKINTEVEVNNQGTIVKGICKDLSGSGMLLSTEAEFDLGSEIAVSIPQDGLHLPFNATAEVTRLQHKEGSLFTWGLTIKEINET